MMVGWLEIELRSELCTTTGGTTAGLIDIEVPHEHGLPFIPAKRLKGSLLEAGKELTDWGVLKKDELTALFGAAGQANSSTLQLCDAHLYKLPLEDGELVIDDNRGLLEQLEHQQDLSVQDVLEQFTSLHTRTAIHDMDGVAADGSLRTMRAINKGLTLRSRIELHATEETECRRLLKTLTLCTKALRSLGIANTRGNGEIRCKLSAFEFTPSVYTAVMTEERKANLSIESEWGELPFRLLLEQPVIVAKGNGLDTDCTEWIPGSALLGAFAGLYIRAFGLGDRAHEDERFARLFLRGGVQFGYAMPMQGNVVFAPCPALWQRKKNENRVCDLSVGSAEEKVVLRNFNRMVYRDTATSTLWKHEVRKQIRMHHARASNRAIGRALGREITAYEQNNESLESDANERGQLYQYESLTAGQQFCGVLRGRRGDLRLLQELASLQGNRLRLGRSRAAEYGNVRFYCGEEESRALLISSPEEQESDRFMIVLVTPMLLLDETGRPDPDPHWLIGELQKQMECDIVPQTMQLRYTTLSGYNAQWRLPKPQRAALDAGSALVITAERLIAVWELEATRWGANIGEGCGQIKAIPLPPGKDGDLAQVLTLKSAERRLKDDEKRPAVPHPLLKLLIVRRDEMRRQRKQQIEGAQEAEKMAKAKSGISKTRIRRLLELAERGQEDYAGLMKKVDEIADDAIKAACRELLRPCEDKDGYFIRGYLRALELQGRNEKR